MIDKTIAITHENKEQKCTVWNRSYNWEYFVSDHMSMRVWEKREKKEKKKGKRKEEKKKEGKKKKRGEVFQKSDSHNPARLIAASREREARRDAAICAKSFTIELQTSCANTV